MSASQSSLINEMGDKSVITVLFAQGNAQTGDIKTPRQKISPIRLLLGIIGTALVVISQLYSLRKREVFIQKGSIKSWLTRYTYFGPLGIG
jgi:hypothetical protein